jgi:GWxTD domain-containing protein
MKRKGFDRFGYLLSVVMVLGIGAMIVPLAIVRASQQDQDQTETKHQKDPNKSKKKEEVKSVYKKWLEEEVVYIITDEERRAFKVLKTDEERDAFIEEFWRRRDPDPDTPENEYKDEYYERVQYANEHFASGVPGWKTDRGRIYITFGKPDEIESHPAGGPYDRPSYEGGGETETYPFEDWWYRYIEGVGSDIEIEFVDPTGSGEYHIAQNPEEKDAMLYVPGAGQTLAEQMGVAQQSDRVMAAQGFGMDNSPINSLFGQRAKDSPFERLSQWAALQKAPPVKFADLQVKADLPEVAADVLPFSVRTDFLRISADSVVTSITLQFDHSDLSFKNVGGIYGGSVNIYARIIALAGKKASQFEDVVSTNQYTEAQLPIGQTQRSLYNKTVVLPPGRYKVDVVCKDINSGKTGIVHHSFQVPKYQDNQLATSTLIPAASIQTLARNTIHAGQFVLGNFKVEPYVSRVYHPGQNLALYLQVYDAAMDQATLRPALKVEYIISKDGKEIKDILEDGKSKLGFVDLKGQQLTVVRSIPLVDELAQPGSYTVTVKVTDLVAQKTVSPEDEYTVTPPVEK